MPRKSDSTPINNAALDKRVKLTAEDKVNIVNDYATGLFSQRALATKYGVSRRSIQFILSPEKKERAKQLYAERQKDGRYYDKDRHNAYTRKHRAHKKELYAKGLIGTEEK